MLLYGFINTKGRKMSDNQDDTIGDECTALQTLFSKEMNIRWKDQVVRLNQLAIFTVDQWGRGIEVREIKH